MLCVCCQSLFQRQKQLSDQSRRYTHTTPAFDCLLLPCEPARLLVSVPHCNNQKLTLSHSSSFRPSLSFSHPRTRRKNKEKGTKSIIIPFSRHDQSSSSAVSCRRSGRETWTGRTQREINSLISSGNTITAKSVCHQMRGIFFFR